MERQAEPEKRPTPEQPPIPELQPSPEPQPAVEKRSDAEKQPEAELPRTPPVDVPDASQIVPHQAANRRLEGQERQPADPLVFPKEFERDLEVQLSDFKHHR